jgi:hypothetical protein
LNIKKNRGKKMNFALIFEVFLFLNIFYREILALKCVTSDGLQIEDVRKVIKKCMKKLTVDYDSIDSYDRIDGENEAKNYYQYENFDEDFEMRNKDLDTNEEERDKHISSSRQNNDRMNNYGKNYNPSRLNHNYDYQQTPQTGGNYYEMNRRNDGHDSPQYNLYQFKYNDNNNFNNQKSTFHSNNTSQNKNNYNSANDKGERDRSCILQCFFQELKMV